VYIPVSLNAISLVRPYYYNGAKVVHMLFLSWAGSQINRQKSRGRSISMNDPIPPPAQSQVDKVLSLDDNGPVYNFLRKYCPQAAKKVIAWLGPERDGSDLAFEKIKWVWEICG
jgi:hypothetical protein